MLGDATDVNKADGQFLQNSYSTNITPLCDNYTLFKMIICPQCAWIRQISSLELISPSSKCSCTGGHGEAPTDETSPLSVCRLFYGNNF